MSDFKDTNWYRYMEEPMRDLARQTYELLGQERRRVEEYKEPEKHDYAFVVFPLAKAYEGFLKKLLWDLRLISANQYKGEYFRIGKALNPNLPKRYRSGWVYGRLVNSCGGESLPLHLWEVWKRARNRIFHFFPDHHEFIGPKEASDLVGMLGLAMERAIEGCKVALA